MCTKRLLPFLVIALVTHSIAQAGPFGSWAARGVVLNKTFRPTPLSHSLGVDGIYRLELRGPDKKVRRQMVTREIYLAYEIGDAFDEQAKLVKHAPAKDVRLAASTSSTPTENPPVAAPAKTESLADVLAAVESRNRLASENFPREMRPETEGF